MAEEAAHHGARLVVAWIPMEEQVNDQQWQLSLKEHETSSDSRFQPQQILSRMVDGLELTPVDLLPAFSKAAGQVRLHFENDGHWTPAGHRLAAQELVPVVQAWRGAEAALHPPSATGP